MFEVYNPIKQKENFYTVRDSNGKVIDILKDTKFTGIRNDPEEPGGVEKTETQK